MTPQSTFMIAAAVRVGQLENLRALLASMSKIPGHADPDNSLVSFSRFDRLHFARFVIIEAKTAHEIKEFGIKPRPWRPTLAFLGDIDGDIHTFFVELAERAESSLKKIFSHCEGFSGDDQNLLEWMKAHNISPQVTYVNWIGRTVKQIHEEAALHRSLSTYLQKIVDDVGRENIRGLRQKLLSYVEMEKYKGRLTLSPSEPTPPEWKARNLLHKIGVPLVLLLLSPLLLVIALFFALRLRMLERSDPELFIRPSREHLAELTVQEDWDVSNQYSVFGDVKPGVVRLL